MNRPLFALLAAGLVAACGDLLPPVPVNLVPEGEGSLLPPPPPPTEPPTAPPVDAAVADAAAEPLPADPDASVGPVEPVLPSEPPAPPTEAPLRPRRRMDIDQLDRAIRQVAGGLGWTEVRNGVEINLFTDLSATLGKADFIQTTVDNLETSAIFQKFLGDAARSVCEKRLAADVAAPDDTGRVVLPTDAASLGALDQAAIDGQIIRLRAAFHGVRLAPDSPELASWRWLYDSTLHVSREPVHAWNAVCVALFTHPDFYTY